MAERRPARDADTDIETEERAPRRKRLSAAMAGQAGLQQITELIGKDPDSVSGVEPLDDGWRVTVEIVEDHRIPSSTDLLGTYQIEVDPEGELLAYRRVRRYARGRGDSDEDS
jgi:hypothetical protein